MVYILHYKVNQSAGQGLVFCTILQIQCHEQNAYLHRGKERAQQVKYLGIKYRQLKSNIQKAKTQSVASKIHKIVSMTS